MFKKDLFRAIAIPALAVVGVLAVQQSAQAGVCVDNGEKSAICHTYFENGNYICVNDPVDGQYGICMG